MTGSQCLVYFSLRDQSPHTRHCEASFRGPNRRSHRDWRRTARFVARSQMFIYPYAPQLSNMFDIHSPMLGFLWWKSCNNQEERCCVLLPWLYSQGFNHKLFLGFSFFGAKHTSTSHDIDCLPYLFFPRKSCSVMWVSVRSHVCGITTINGRCVVLRCGWIV